MVLHRYGINCHYQLTDLEVEMRAFILNPPQGLGKVEHFWNICNILWGAQNKANKRKVFERNPWTDRMAYAACREEYLALSGCAACVAGDTKLLNPLTGETPTIQYLCENNIRPLVMTMDGPALASVPFVKGIAPLYEVVLEHGGKFHATAFHRVYTSTGFVSVSSLLPGSLLVGYEPCHPQSMLGNAHSIHRKDVRSFQRIAEGFQGRCSVCCDLDDEPLRPVEDIARELVPLQVDVPKCKACTSGHWDDLDSKASDIHLYPHAYRLANLMPSGREGHMESAASLLPFLESPLRESQLSRPPVLSHSGRHLPHSLLEPYLGFVNRQMCVDGEACYSSRNLTVSETAVQAISSIGTAPFYDLQVPGPNHYFAEGAIHHNSGKTEFAAVWAIVNWLVAPEDTLVFCTSTSLKESNRRIWGRIKKFWQESAFKLPGKLVDSMYTIRTDNGSGVFSDEQGIVCIAGEKKNEKEAIGKMIGAHPKRLILLVDEMPEITEAILTAALSNMAINPHFQLIGIGNFKSAYDTFGVFSKPKMGYGSVTVEDEEWETDFGVALRFDGMKSPNVIGGRDVYECYDSKDLATHRKNYGEDSAEFWRMCRSFGAPIGTSDVLYSDADLLAGRCELRIPSDGLSWLGPRTRLTSLDPSYTNGGDRSVQWFGWWGVLTNGLWVLCFDKYMLVRDSVNDPSPRDYQIVRKFRDNARNEGVDPRNAAFDGTAASSFASIVSEEWSPQVLKVEFGGAPSSRCVATNDNRKANELFDRRVSELWGVGRDFLRAGQLKGMVPELCRELKARKYETSKRGSNVIIVVEEKKKMKARLGFSPDLADSALVMLELIRARHGALAGGIATGRRAAVSNFFKIAKEKDKVYSDLYAEADS